MEDRYPDPVKLSSTLATRLAFPRTPGDEKAYTDAILSQLKQERLLWVVAPQETGDAALSIADTARITFNIARVSGSAGLIYAMHMSQALTLVRHQGESPYLRALVGRLAHDQALVASGTSEKGVGGDIFGSVCAIESIDEQTLSVTKDSPNISYMDHAGAVLISAMRDINSRKSQVLIAAKADEIKWEAGRSNEFMGMRGILNRPYKLTAQFSSEAIFAESYPAIAKKTMTPSIHIFWAALWSGLAASALDKARACISAMPANESEISNLMRGDLTRLVDRHYAMNALIRDAIAEFSQTPYAAAVDLAGTARVKRLKTTCSDYLSEICVGVLGILGIRGYAENGPLSISEILRDALSAKVMISNYRLLANNAKIERFVEETL